ncbi:MAG: hypothetical protein HY243_02540 [Proteobacteria bacterium]|nr:hypothetical protein [Pseudomonadota bacterium]
MDTLAIARILHILGVIIWIGGMAFVTLVVLPIAAKLPDSETRADMFERLERRFAWIARAAVLVVGISGTVMADGYGLWAQFIQASGWWLDAMAGWWIVFFLILFVAEPLFLHRRFSQFLRRDSDRALKFLTRAHWVLLLVSLCVVAAAVAGVHGY